LSRLVDRDLVRDSVHAVEACNVVIRRVVLELVGDVSLEGDPAVLDLDVDRVGRHLGVPDQGLQGHAADLVVLTTIGVDEVDLELVIDLIGIVEALGVLGCGTPLAEALDGPAQRDDAAVG
jgi:hypothetical protein